MDGISVSIVESCHTIVALLYTTKVSITISVPGFGGLKLFDVLLRFLNFFFYKNCKGFSKNKNKININQYKNFPIVNYPFGK